MADNGTTNDTIETRPGPKTTEFYATLFTNLLGTFELIFGGLNVSNEWVMVALAVVNGLYAASRGIAKQGIPNVEQIEVRDDTATGAGRQPLGM